MEKLRNMLQVIMDQIDYTGGACRVNEPIGGVIDSNILAQARQVLRETKPSVAPQLTSKKFFEDLFALYDRYDVSISHQDGEGAFIIETNDPRNREWIGQASISSSVFAKGTPNG